MADDKKTVQKSPLSHILGIPSASKKRAFSEKRMEPPERSEAPKEASEEQGTATAPTMAPEPAKSEVQEGSEETEKPKPSINTETAPSPPQNPPETQEKPHPEPHSSEKPQETAEQQHNEAEETQKEAPTEPQEPAEDAATDKDEAGDAVSEGAKEGDTSGDGDAEEAGKEAEAGEKRDSGSASASPSPKRPRIDSSNVLASVAHFKDFLAREVVYVPRQPLLKGVEDHLNSHVWVRVARRYLTRKNTCVERRMLWGTDVYTDDSDVVAALYHGGHLDADNEATKRNATGDFDLMVTVKILPRLLRYTGCYLHGLNSRTWPGHHDGCSFRIERVTELPRGSAESPACEVLERARTWGLAYLQQKDVRASLASAASTS